MASEDNLVIPKFYIDTIKNEKKSKEAGRPIFDERELVEVRFAGDRNKVSHFPAHAVCGTLQDEDGNYAPMTYAQRWSKQYQRFKEKSQQVMEGTPIDELPFLSASKRSELKALSIYTAETLAALDGQPLKNLGQGGRELKNQAQAYLDKASGSADVTRMASEIEELKQMVAQLQGQKPAEPPAPTEEVSQFAAWSSDQIKDWIEQQINERPRGNPSHSTLVARAEEIAVGLSEQAA